MKLIINSSLLKKTMQDVMGVVGKDLTMPILSHVLIEKNKKEILISGTNLEVQISSSAVFVESDEFDPITVSGRKLYEIVRSLDKQDIELSVKNTRLILKTSNSTFKLSILPSNNKSSLKHDIYYWLKGKCPLNAMNMSEKVAINYLKYIKKRRIKYVYGYASSIFLLAKAALNHNIKVDFIKACITTSEILTPYYKGTIINEFNC